MNDNYCVPGSPNEQYEGNYNKGGVTVGCGCKTFKDIVNFAKEKRIEYADLTYADEMGLWHHIVVPMADLAMTVNPDFGVVTTKDGKILRPDPLSAKVSPFSHPNVMFVTCMDVSYDHVGQERGRDERVSGRDLKTKQLNPNLVEMVQRRMMETQTRQSGEIERLLNNEEQPQMGFYQKPGDNFIEWKMVSKAERNRYSPPTTPPVVPGSPEDSPNQFSDSSPTESPTMTSSVPSSMTLTMNLQNLKMKLPMEGFESLDLPPGYKPPPLLRPRQVHPCKNKLDDKKSKKRKIMEHMFCRHCGAKDTPEWRRGPDGRKSLCNACGLHYSKVVKKETMTVSAGRTVSVHSLLNPA